MPQIKLTLDKETYDEIKKLAKEDERSATQYISRLIRQHVGTLATPITTPIYVPATGPNICPTSPLIPIASDATTNPLMPDLSVPSTIGRA